MGYRPPQAQRDGEADLIAAAFAQPTLGEPGESTR